MTDIASLLGTGAQRIVALLGRYLDAQRIKKGKRLDLIRALHAALLEVDADYRTIFSDLETTLEDLDVEPDRVAAKATLRTTTRTLRHQRESFDAARTSIRALARNLMLFTEDPQTRYYLWAVTAYMLDEEPGIGFPGNVPAAVERLLARDVGAMTRTPSSVVLKALEDGSTPSQALAIVKQRRAQMKIFLGYAIEQYAWMIARELK